MTVIIFPEGIAVIVSGVLLMLSRYGLGWITRGGDRVDF